jgi:uncharacterized oxidoreductase
MFSIVISPERAGVAENLQAEMDAFVRFVCASPVQGGVDRVRVPGDPEIETRAARLASGISIDDATWTQIVAAGVTVGAKEDELERLVTTR